MSTFFSSSNLLSSLSAAIENASTSSEGTFIYDSQVSSTVHQNALAAIQNDMDKNSSGSTSRLDVNNSVTTDKLASILLNNNVTNGNTKYIDKTEFGDLTDAFLSSMNRYNAAEQIAYVTDVYYKDKDANGENKKNEQTTTNLKQVYSTTPVVKSIFNPYYGIKSRGAHTNLPLRDIEQQNSTNARVDTSDCSIWALLQASARGKAVESLGSEYYTLADFMFCKDLGKVANNHMITLRRYAFPVGDNIYGPSNTGDPDSIFSGPSDIGHLVTWFGTEDNKLSSILKMSFHATWKEMTASWTQDFSKTDENASIFGIVANTLDPKYNAEMNSGKRGDTNLVSKFMSNFNTGLVNFGKPGQYMNNNALTNYDQHKIYTPKNTIQSNNYYEGKIEFENEFSLVFSYKMRSYSDINQKAAMLDLIGNILRVSFTEGTFWGGKSEIIGAHGADSTIKKMDAFVDNTFDKLSGWLNNVINGNVDWKALYGSLTTAAKDISDSALGEAKQIADNPTGKAQEYAKNIADLFKGVGIADAIKGTIKNALGRPAMYALQSLVSGDNLGLWHVTIGNPKNPIVTMGNLILTNAELEFGDAPLGLDDFPTEIKATITLKHCKPRDSTDIQRMFSKGETSIYIPLGQHGWTEYWKENSENVSSRDKYNQGTYQQIFGTSVTKTISTNFAELSNH